MHLCLYVSILAILLLPESWRSSSFESAGPAHFHAPAFIDEVDIGAGYLISGSRPGWCCVFQPARFSHLQHAGELFGTAPASSPNSRQQGAEPVFLFSHLGVQFTHNHTIRANPAVLPRQTVGPALPTAALGKGRMRASSSNPISPRPALLPATGVKERWEEGHFSLSLSPHSKQRGEGINPAALIPPQTSSPAPPSKRSPPLIKSWFESISCQNLTEKVLRIRRIPFLGKWMQPEIVLLKIRHIQKANVSFFLSYVESLITLYVRIYIDGYVYVCRCMCRS